MVTRRVPQIGGVVTSPARVYGMGGWDYDPLTGEWVEVLDPAPPVIPPGTPNFEVTVTATPLLDPAADHGLPGKPPCDPNGLYPRGHRCDIRQQYVDAQNVVRVVQTATGPRPAGGGTAAAGRTVTQQLSQLGADAAAWVSRNSGMAAVLVVGLLVVGMSGGSRRGRR